MKRILPFTLFVLTFSFAAFAFGPGGGNPGGNPGGGGWQPGGGGNQPDQPGGGGAGGGTFVYDTFLTDATVAGGCIVYGNLLTGYVADVAEIVVPAPVTKIADGALAGNADVVSIDATAATGLTAIPDSFASGCGNLAEVGLPPTVTTIGPSAFAMDAELEKVYAEGVVETGENAFYGSPLAKVSASSLFVVSFDANGGVCGTASVKVEAGEALGELPMATRTGYDFVGWYTDATGGSEIEEWTVVSANMTVCAHWERQETPVLSAGETSQIAPYETSVSGTVTWSAKGLPAGMKIAAKDLTDRTLGTIAAGTIYGAPTKPGTYVVTITAKGSSTETFTEEIVVGNYVDEMIPVADRYGTYRVGAKTTLDLSDFVDCKVSGLPAGLKFATKAVTDSTFGSVAAGWVYGVPTKACTNTVTFTKTVKEVVDGKSKSVTHKATATFVVVGLPTWAVGTFNGLFNDGSGSATLTVSTVGKSSGKIMSSGKTLSFSSAGFEAVDPEADAVSELRLAAVAKNGKLTEVLDLSVTSEGAVGTFDGGIALSLWRNAWKDKGATDVLAPYVGVYTVQLASSETGTGYLSLTLDAKGNCKATGKLPDGTSASGTLPLVWDADAGAPFAVWQTSPSAYKGGSVGGILTWSADKTVTATQVIWTSLASTSTASYGEGFSRDLLAKGTWYDKLATLSDYYSTLAFMAEAPVLDVTVKTTAYVEDKRQTTSETQAVAASDMDCWDRLTLSLDAKGTSFAVDQGSATKPVQDGETKVWSYAGENDAALTFGFTKATGIFRGTFTYWYDYVSATDLTKDPAKETATHSSKKVSYEGIMVPGEALRGYYLWERTGEYADEKTGKTKYYKYKESRSVSFE